MSRYRKVDPRIWNDAKFRALSNKGKLVFFLLLTHPHMTALGAMRATPSGLAEELNWQPEAFREVFAEVLAAGMAEHDQKACLIALPKFLKYNPPESPNVVKAWVGALDLLPECELKTTVLQRAGDFADSMTKGFGQAFREAFDKAMPNQEQEQEQKQKKHPPTPRASRGEPSDAFKAFWSTWPAHQRKVAIEQCWAKWQTRECEAIADQIVAHVRAMKASEAWTKDGGEFIPAPLVYLNQKRWTAPIDMQAQTEWYETAGGIKAKGAELGMPYTSEDECKPWQQYAARVFKAAGHSPRAAA